eukprot:UN09697
MVEMRLEKRRAREMKKMVRYWRGKGLDMDNEGFY